MSSFCQYGNGKCKLPVYQEGGHFCLGHLPYEEKKDIDYSQNYKEQKYDTLSCINFAILIQVRSKYSFLK